MQKKYLKAKVNILIACDANKSRPWFRDRIPSIKKAISDVEWTVDIVDLYSMLGVHKFMPTDLSAREKFLQTANIIQINQNFKELVLKKNPDVLLLGTVDNYRDFLIPDTITSIRENGILVSGILGDDEFNHSQNRFFIGWFDSFVAYVKSCVEYYDKLNLSKGYYFPNSCYLNGYKFSDYSQDTKYDVILIGAPIANRPFMMQSLIDAGLKVAIYGSSEWNKYDRIKNCYLGFVATEDFDKVMQSSKIVLAFLEDDITGSLHMNTKIWEAVRVARLPITTMYSPLIHDYGLVQHDSIVMYESEKNLVELALYYSNHDKERISIARKLFEKVQNEFDYYILYKELFNSLIFDSLKLSRVNPPLILNQSEVIKYLNNLGVFYISSGESKIDAQVINIVKIAKKSPSLNLIYFNRIENGMGVRQIWPFINFDSVISFAPVSGKLHLLLKLFLAIFSGKIMHVRQFLVISEEYSITGYINMTIRRMVSSNFGRIARSKLQAYKVR
jgi:hypothetical protein